MSAEESELSGTANHEKEGPGGGEANKTAAPKNVNRPVCHNIFPHRPAIPGDLFPKERGGRGVMTVTIQRQKPSSSFPPSGRIRNLFLKSSFSATKVDHMFIPYQRRSC